MLIQRILKPFGYNPPPYVPVIRLTGVIGPGTSFRPGISLSHLAAAIERAFSIPDRAAVALAINSPGGSPVQSALVAGRIRQLADEKKVPVLAFCEDVAASGGYWLACAADEIYADTASIVGSIGVVSAGFGFQKLIESWGIERRVYTAGERKSMLDPFRPEDPEDIARLRRIQTEIHETFKDLVRRRRGDRLKAPEEDLFNGDIWTGARALELGLVDGLGDLRSVLRQRFGEKVRVRTVHTDRRWFMRRLRVDARNPLGGLASELPDAVLSALEERALWGRYGL